MTSHLSRRTLLIALPTTALLGSALPAAADPGTAFSAFRLIRRRPGSPTRPEITLPDGYSVVEGEQYDVASRAEYYTFIEGPAADEIEVTVRWPGVAVAAVVHQEQRLPVRRTSGDGFSFTVPVTTATTGELQPTLQIWSHPESSEDYYWAIEHNDADRAAGPWVEVPWPAGAVRSVLHQVFAIDAVWHDAGLLETAAAKGHRWVLQGFETNNTLHADNPPHWHITYNSGPDFSSPTHLPHLWLDEQGRNFYNGMDVTGLGRLKYYVGDPAPLYDFVGDANDGRGNLVVTITIREDGGLDIDPPDGPRYAMTAGGNGDLLEEVRVLRDDRPWLRVRVKDRVDVGVLAASITDLQSPANSREIVQRYDALTGVLR